MNQSYIDLIAKELNLPRKHIAATATLLEDGATVPFIRSIARN